MPRELLKNTFKRIHSLISKLTSESLLGDEEENSDQEDEMLRNIAKKIHEYGLEGPAITLLETIKPLAFLGARFIRMYLGPFFYLFGIPESNITIFESRKNIEKLIKLIEKKGELRNKGS